ncbi:unnamed protein product [Microthlaspi erraticum]|uniref:TF-B3 domain-containing protein n=1 Tax=Microthlaspi erraticum TaxID=1685480 RepID=A0A6D2J9F3_9BRAS|nr:unnamed protein product [Microthlaspi erraticum]CAA7036414.1 unnamed protein product [Microthlaspi erraticum]
MNQGVNLDLSLAQYDPWVIKKKLTATDTSNYGKLSLSQRGMGSITPQMRQSMREEMETIQGVEVKVHVIEEGNQAEDYTWRLVRESDGKYYMKGGWIVNNGYQEGDVIGLM